VLKGKKILIVGGSSGIGRAVAKHACENGAHVVIASRSAIEKRDDLCQYLGESIEVHACDSASDFDHLKLFDAVGPMDHLVFTVRPDNEPSPFLTIDTDEAKRAFDIKFWGPYRMIKTAHRYIRPGGSIILTSGIAGEKIYAGSSTMALINSATETLCRILAVELAPVRVNAVSPGFVEPKAKEIQDYSRTFPAGKLASVDDVASVYLCLMGNFSMTGEIIKVDGGARLI
jgi:NAD(P)-dependent dehydrogenase (short-subunit alcohol dehydrogenase family)